MSEVRTCRKCGVPLDLVRPATIILPCPECKVSLEIRSSSEGNFLIQAAGAQTSSVLRRPESLHLSQLDLFFRWEKVEKSVTQSMENPILGQCSLCKGDIFLGKTEQAVVECEYCGGRTPVKAEELMTWKKEADLTFPASLLSFIKKMARPLDLEERKRVTLKYLHLYRWLFIILLAALLLLAVFALRGLLSST